MKELAKRVMQVIGRCLWSVIAGFLLLVWTVHIGDYIGLGHTLVSLFLASVITTLFLLYNALRLWHIARHYTMFRFLKSIITFSWVKSVPVLLFACMLFLGIHSFFILCWFGSAAQKSNLNTDVQYAQINPVLTIVLQPIFLVDPELRLTYGEIRTREFYTRIGLTGTQQSRHYERDGFSDAVDISVKTWNTSRRWWVVTYLRTMGCIATVHGNPLHLHVSVSYLLGDDALTDALRREGRDYYDLE